MLKQPTITDSLVFVFQLIPFRGGEKQHRSAGGKLSDSTMGRELRSEIPPAKRGERHFEVSENRQHPAPVIAKWAKEISQRNS